MGALGLKVASGDAVLNANYLKERLSQTMQLAFDRQCMHEFVIDGAKLPTSPLNLSKRLIDFGIHPPTLVGAGCVYYGDNLSQAMLFEPTETESKAELDHLVEIINIILTESLNDDLSEAPFTTPVRRINIKDKCLL